MKTSISHFTELVSWQKSHALVLNVYKITRLLPSEERFGLSSQMQRAAVSVTSNIAEGFNRTSQKEKLQFYSIALGSVSELQSQLYVVYDLNMLEKPEFQDVIQRSTEVHKLLNGLMKSVRSKVRA